MKKIQREIFLLEQELAYAFHLDSDKNKITINRLAMLGELKINLKKYVNPKMI